MDYFFHIGILVCIYAILAVSLNLVLGFTGLVSMAHAAFYAIGAYAVAIGSERFGMNFFSAALYGVVASSAAAVAVGAVLSKYKDEYYVLVSLGFTGIIYTVLLNVESITKGAYGITGIRRPEVFSVPLLDNFSFFILAATFLFVTLLVSSWIVKSSFGRVLRAIREDEQAIQVFGYQTFWYKFIVFIASAALASTAGALFAAYIAFVDPSTFTIHESVFIVAMVALGGIASIRGSVLGAILLVLLPEVLRFLGLPQEIAAQMRHVVYGSLIVILMLYRPQGFLGTFKL